MGILEADGNVKQQPLMKSITCFLLSEVNIMWAAHQTHHSSEDYHLMTALRQSVIQRYFAWVCSLDLP